jgi:hypothetical protein
MFRGEKVIRFYAGACETTVLRTVRETLGSLGQINVERDGAIRIEPGRGLRSALATTTLSGRLRKRNREYEVRITYTCAPTPMGWAIMALGTVFGWATRRKVAETVRGALRHLGGTLVGMSDGRFGGKNDGIGRGFARVYSAMLIS